MGQIKNIKLYLVPDIKVAILINTMAFVRSVNFNVIKTGFRVALRRNFAASTVALNEASDPIQKLFLSKLHEFTENASALPEGELFESSPEIEEAKKFEMDNLTRRYGKENMEEFPTFSFQK